MLKMKDFLPQPDKPPELFSKQVYQTLEDTVAAAGEWLKTSGVKLVQLETVVVPNIRKEDSSQAAKFIVSYSNNSQWYQFIRVWYEE